MSSTIHIAVGDIHALLLDSMSGAGYTWQVAANDATITDIRFYAPVASANTTPSIGGSLKTRVEIIGLKKGVSKIHLIQKRVWEVTATPLEEIRLTVFVA